MAKTNTGRKRHREPWQAVLDEPIEDPGITNRPKADPVPTDDHGTYDGPQVVPTTGGLDQVVDVDYHGRSYEVEQAPLVPGDDGDDDPVVLSQPMLKVATDNLGKETSGPRKGQQKDITKPEDIVYPVRVKMRLDNLPAQMIEAGHGFLIDDSRSRPWKTAPRTNCAYCGGQMPEPTVTGAQYRCEFDPQPDCQCSACVLRALVVTGRERGTGNPPMCCSANCKRLRDNERGRWRRACASAEKRGAEPPPEPEDRGLKFVELRGGRSGREGNGHRYVASSGLPWWR